MEIKKDFMTEEEFSLLNNLIHKEFGIFLKGDKRLTLHTKVSHRLNILGLKTYRNYYDFIISDPSKDELYTLASHITNNETYFFREKTQLDVFAELLKEIKREKVKRNENTFRILSLACSSGEEPYTLSIIIQESGLFVWDWDIKITGMDIDRNAINRAKSACYTKNSFRALNGDSSFINKYFAVDGNNYNLRKILTRNVEFRHGNVVDSNSFVGLGSMDVIFCRNVLIYMSDEAIEKTILNLYNCLTDCGGYLIVGSAESLIQKTDLFSPEYTNGIIVYKKNAKS